MKPFGLLCLALAALGPASLAQPPAASPAWWVNGRWRFPHPNPKAALLPLVSVQGNRFVDPSGKPLLFRGLAVADPDKLAAQGQWNRDLFLAVQGMGANLVRIPVHPIAWRHLGPQAYLKLLDQAVDWCTDLGMYVIIDWHSIGNLHSEMFQAPMYDTTQKETLDFWRTMAMHFRGNHTVAFFELFNEPSHYRGMLGPMSWSQWRELNEEIIGVIRFWDKQTIPLVAGFDWAYDLDNVHYDPVRAEGIGYTVHPYANKRTQPWEPKWEEDFAFVSETYPMIATEFGFAARPGQPDGPDDYGNRITRFLEQHGISWVAWVFDPQWGPPMLQSFDGFRLSGSGVFFKEAMHRPPAPLLAPPKPVMGTGQ